MVTFPVLLISFATTSARAENTLAQSDRFKSVEPATASARPVFVMLCADFAVLIAFIAFIAFIGAMPGILKLSE